MTFKPVLTGFAGRKAICDAETYPNFILIKFEDVDTGEVHRFVIDETRNESHAAFAYFKSLSVVVTYNGHGFDDHILDKVFYGYDHQTIYEIANDIINSDSRSFSPFLHRDGSPRIAIRCPSTSPRYCGTRSVTRTANRYSAFLA